MGCSVLWKPAPTATYSAYIGMKLLEEAGLPPGVINMVQGDPQMISKEVLSHPEFSGLHFTGSTATFENLWKQIGENISLYKNYPRIVGETGSKDFVFAHKSADKNQLITALIRGAFEYQGQKCSAASRAYIPKTLWSEIKEELIQQTSKIKMGSPLTFLTL